MKRFDTQQASNYERWFDTPFGRRTDRVEKAILGQLLRDYPGTGSVLEVGSGTGHFARWFASTGLSVVGLDVSKSMLAVSRDLCPQVDVVLGDALHLPFADSSFDLVAMITSLEFVSQPGVALQEAARVARQGILLGVLNSISPIAAWRRLGMLGKRGVYSQARFYSPYGLERLARRSLGTRASSVRWETGLYTLPWLDGLTCLPFGAFIGMSVGLNKGG